MGLLWDKIFIISLPAEKTRRGRIIQNLKALNFLDYEVFSAIKPEFKSIPEEHYCHMSKKYNKKYVVGACGCSYSHKEIIKLAKERNYKSFLVFEDDAVINKKILLILNNFIQQLGTRSWAMIYLGFKHKIKKQKQVSKNIVEAAGLYSTYGYIMHNSIYDFVINNMNKSGKEIDVFYCTKVHTKFPTYCMIPQMVKEGTGISSITGRKH